MKEEKLLAIVLCSIMLLVVPISGCLGGKVKVREYICMGVEKLD